MAKILIYTLIIVLVVLMPYAGMIPMPTIAAILFIVAYNMCQWRTFRDLVKTAPKSDILVLIVTFVLTVIFDLVVAIEIGMVLACLLFIKRMSEETHADSWVYTDDDTPDIDEHLQKLPLQIRVYEITGPLFFGAADAIEHIVVKDFTRFFDICSSSGDGTRCGNTAKECGSDISCALGNQFHIRTVFAVDHSIGNYT